MTYMPFGVFRGKELFKVPTNYLSWVETKSWVQQNLRDAVKAELKRRADRNFEDEPKVEEPEIQIEKRKFSPVSKRRKSTLKKKAQNYADRFLKHKNIITRKQARMLMRIAWLAGNTSAKRKSK